MRGVKIERGELNMSTKIFISEEEILKKEREEALKHAIRLWELFSEEYKTLLDKYYKCLEEKKKRKLTLYKLPITKEDYPNIPFLKIQDHYSAENFLNRKSTREIRQIINAVEEAVRYNYAYSSIKEWIRDANYLIARTDKNRTAKVEPAIGRTDKNSMWP